jgi:hypothetical protein
LRSGKKKKDEKKKKKNGLSKSRKMSSGSLPDFKDDNKAPIGRSKKFQLFVKREKKKKSRQKKKKKKKKKKKSNQ